MSLGTVLPSGRLNETKSELSGKIKHATTYVQQVSPCLHYFPRIFKFLI